MDAVVQVLPLAVRGSGSTPSSVNAGDGGQAAALIAPTGHSGGIGDSTGLVVLLVVALAGLGVFARSSRRPAAVRSGGGS